MPVSDPIADLLTRIRNAHMVRHESIELPTSKTKVEIMAILKDNGYVSDFRVSEDKPVGTMKVKLLYGEDQKPAITGLKRVSKPGLRVYVQKGEASRVYGGIGISIISTSQGMMTGRNAWRKRLGGELLCYVW